MFSLDWKHSLESHAFGSFMLERGASAEENEAVSEVLWKFARAIYGMFDYFAACYSVVAENEGASSPSSPSPLPLASPALTPQTPPAPTFLCSLPAPHASPLIPSPRPPRAPSGRVGTRHQVLSVSFIHPPSFPLTLLPSPALPSSPNPPLSAAEDADVLHISRRGFLAWCEQAQLPHPRDLPGLAIEELWLSVTAKELNGKRRLKRHDFLQAHTSSPHSPSISSAHLCQASQDRRARRRSCDSRRGVT